MGNLVGLEVSLDVSFSWTVHQHSISARVWDGNDARGQIIYNIVLHLTFHTRVLAPTHRLYRP